MLRDNKNMAKYIGLLLKKKKKEVATTKTQPELHTLVLCRYLVS